jgi:hypothetical protein
MKHLGTILFALMSLVGLVRVMLERPVSGHYRVFTGAARLLQQGRDPYEYDFQSVGYWFYSPACGLFFYSLFSWMPDLIGLFVYSVASIASIYIGVRYFLQEVGYTEPRFQWALALISIPVYQGLVAAKIETIMMALFLICIVGWWRKRYFWPSLLMGLLLEWKFQVAPMAGLFGLWLLLTRRTFWPLFFLGISAGFWHFLPAVFLGWATLQALFLHQKTSLGRFIAESFANFDNLFRFINAIGWNLSFQQSLMVSGVTAVVFAGMVSWGVFNKKLPNHGALPFLALVLGSVYCIGFSPLHQNNASILGLPVFLISAMILSSPQPKTLKWITSLFLLLFHFSYSDLMPEPIRVALRAYSSKAVIAMVYCMVLGIWVLSNKNTQFLQGLCKSGEK